MAQNTSSAVMEQRRAGVPDAPEALDYFPTPPWATRALCEYLDGRLGWNLGKFTCWEPACGQGFMAAPLRESFHTVRATDVFDYGQGPSHLCDFVLDGRARGPMDWVVTNPPFNLALQFVDQALRCANHGVAMLTRSAWLEGGERYRQLFSVRPPSYVLTFTERVVMLEGRLIQSGAPDPFNLDADGKPRKASSATSYSWSVWTKSAVTGWVHDTRHGWIPPSRRQLERPGDYPEYAEQWAAIRTASQGGAGPQLAL